MTERPGASFQDADVVENYRFRPPYPEGIFQRLMEIAPARGSALDIGCGPGKISRALADKFGRVTAVDPSTNMIALGRSLPGGSSSNIEWLEGFAEDFPIAGRTFDLTVAAASIHWMDKGKLFPRIAEHANPGHVFAIVTGDDAFEPPWEDSWVAFLKKWIPTLTGSPYDLDRIENEWEGSDGYLKIIGTEYVSGSFEQSVDDFIRCQHSRDTFSPRKLGDSMRVFDEELRLILSPHASDGFLDYHVRTKLIWGTVRNARMAQS